MIELINHQDLVQQSPITSTDRVERFVALEGVRQTGIPLNYRGFGDGWVYIATSILGSNMGMLGNMGVSAPTKRLNNGFETCELLKTAANCVGRTLRIVCRDIRLFQID